MLANFAIAAVGLGAVFIWMLGAISGGHGLMDTATQFPFLTIIALYVVLVIAVFYGDHIPPLLKARLGVPKLRLECVGDMYDEKQQNFLLKVRVHNEGTRTANNVIVKLMAVDGKTDGRIGESLPSSRREFEHGEVRIHKGSHQDFDLVKRFSALQNPPNPGLWVCAVRENGGFYLDEREGGLFHIRAAAEEPCEPIDGKYNIFPLTDGRLSCRESGLTFFTTTIKLNTVSAGSIGASEFTEGIFANVPNKKKK